MDKCDTIFTGKKTSSQFIKIIVKMTKLNYTNRKLVTRPMLLTKSMFLPLANEYGNRKENILLVISNTPTLLHGSSFFLAVRVSERLPLVYMRQLCKNSPDL